MNLIVIESPYASETSQGRKDNIAYLRRCLRDSLMRGEAPFASHAIYTQYGVLDDTLPEERSRGIAAGIEWGSTAKSVAIYVDRGISGGMIQGIVAAVMRGAHIEVRALDRPVSKDDLKAVYDASAPERLVPSVSDIPEDACPHGFPEANCGPCETEELIRQRDALEGALVTLRGVAETHWRGEEDVLAAIEAANKLLDHREIEDDDQLAMFEATRASRARATRVGMGGVVTSDVAAGRDGLKRDEKGHVRYDLMTDAECCATGYHRRQAHLREACACGYKEGHPHTPTTEGTCTTPASARTRQEGRRGNRS